VTVDVSIDHGGIAETSRPTTHSHPTYYSSSPKPVPIPAPVSTMT
jgi:alanine dehydrogenase